MQYILTILVALILSSRYSKTGDLRLLKLPYSVLCLWNILFFGLRYRVGLDTLNYMDGYWKILPIDGLTISDFMGLHHAPLYALLESICKTISPEFWVLQIAVAAIFNIILFSFLKKHSVNPYLSFAIYFFVAAPHFNTNLMRESLAIAMFLLNYDNYKERRWKKYYSMSLLSIGFHYSAFIILFFPLLRNIRFNKTFLWVVIAFSVFCAFFVGMLLPHLPSGIISDEISRKIRRMGFYNINWFIMHFIRYALAPLLLLLLSRRYKLNELHENILCIYLLLCVGIFFYEMFFVRFTNYLAILLFIYIANYVKSRYVVFDYKMYVLIPLLAVNVWYYASRGHYENYYPYHSVFNPVEDDKRELRRDRMIEETNSNVQM